VAAVKAMVLAMRASAREASGGPLQGPRLRHRHTITVLGSVAIIAAMGVLTYYSAPLYRLFCQVTGFGGTTQVAHSAPGAVAGRTMTVRFDANTAANLAWRFTAPSSVEMRLGESRQVAFTAENVGSEPLLGMAIYNVTPPQIGGYFYKVECFCFTEQLLMPGERKEFPVQFYVDPAIASDPDGRGVNTITLSYTFYNKGSAALEDHLQTHRVAAGRGSGDLR
jgi:cytochrome c oxidase assembly protein subunit 11